MSSPLVCLHDSRFRSARRLRTRLCARRRGAWRRRRAARAGCTARRAASACWRRWRGRRGPRWRRARRCSRRTPSRWCWRWRWPCARTPTTGTRRKLSPTPTCDVNHCDAWLRYRFYIEIGPLLLNCVATKGSQHWEIKFRSSRWAKQTKLYRKNTLCIHVIKFYKIAVVNNIIPKSCPTAEVFPVMSCLPTNL